MDEFLSKFMFDGGLMSIVTGDLHARHKREYSKEPSTLITNYDQQIFFSPALRKQPGDEKDDVLGSIALWVDVDNLQRSTTTLPPSAVLSSGHGWHFYWFLDKPVTDIEALEALNKIVARDVLNADVSVFNCNRLMRVPMSLNLKDSLKPVRCEIKWFNPDRIYNLTDFGALDRLEKVTRHKIRTGDRRGFNSRSERDWAIIVALVRAGASDDLIKVIFEGCACGDKYHDKSTPDTYLSHTITSARNRYPSGPDGSKGVEAGGRGEQSGSGFEEREDGYYVGGRRGEKRISTFTIDPLLLLDGSFLGSEDAIVGNVRAAGYVWEEITFTRSAFTGVNRLDKECPVAAWQWLGRDEEVRYLLPHLLEQLMGKGMPRLVGAPTLGLHKIKGVWYYVGTHQVVSADKVWQGHEGPIAWLPSKAEHAVLDLNTDITEEELRLLAEKLPLLNESEVMWLLLGWYAATALKPWLEANGYRFPILNVSGTRGSGKTTLIQRVLMPLFGQTEPKSYDAGTTKFVMLSCLGSTNSVPMAFSEFRYESVEKFLRYVLLSYDTGHDPRGRADQTTVDYPLSAPFSVDGEDIIGDAAAKERIVAVVLHPAAVEEGSVPYKTYQEIRNIIPKHFGGYFIQQVLQMMQSGILEKLLLQCKQEVFDAFPGRLPDRVRSNHIVDWFGIKLFCNATGAECPSPQLLARSINTVFNMEAGRSRTLSDEFVEAVVNAVPTNLFKYTSGEGVFWFQMSTAYDWWIRIRRSQGRTALERDSILGQLKECPYYMEAKAIGNVWMHGLNLEAAVKFGLDVPTTVHKRELKVSF